NLTRPPAARATAFLSETKGTGLRPGTPPGPQARGLPGICLACQENLPGICLACERAFAWHLSGVEEFTCLLFVWRSGPRAPSARTPTIFRPPNGADREEKEKL